MESVWIFNQNNSSFSGGVFAELMLAEEWIRKNKLTGVLTKYPINQGTFAYSGPK